MADYGNNFVQLHNHTHYSLLDGASKIPDLAKRAAELGMPAVGITDHGNMHGAYEMYTNCVANGVKPIIGIEAYVTPETARQDKSRVHWGTEAQRRDDVSGGGLITHLTMWAENDEGLVNLIKASSVANLEGRVMRYPRMDKEVLATYSKGVIASSGCPSGIIQTRLRLGQFEEALRAAGEFQDIFGKDNFFIELMDHGLTIETQVTNDLLTIAKKLDAPLLATNDSHYVHAEDAQAQDAMLCINSGSRLDDPDRFKFDGTGYYIKTAEEMRELFKDHPDACDNTLVIAERCNVMFDDHEDGAFMPKFPCPEGWDETSLFLKKVEEGLEKRYDGNPPLDVLKQADYECGVICQMQFCGYFLVVADYIQWAKDHGIMVGPGRGSAAGAMVAYSMGITELDPLKHGLIFERFLNPERVSLPDIDVDFDPEGRARVIEYCGEKYGTDKVAQCVIYGTIKTKQALKDSARIMGYEFSVGEKITKALPPAATGGKDISLHDIFDPAAKRYAEAREFRELYDSDPDTKRITEEAKGIEGLIRQTGVHACATIMGSAPITDTSPLLERTDGTTTTTFEYHTCETLGLVKMDFLGLSNLTIIHDTLKNIEANGKPAIDYTKIPLDDAETYKLMSRGDTLGVFQLDSDGMRSLLKTLKPDNFNDISALIALYRPGPMSMDSHINYAKRKNGLQKITPIHPELEEPLKQVLDETYGLIIYQEQVQSAARILAQVQCGLVFVGGGTLQQGGHEFDRVVRLQICGPVGDQTVCGGVRFVESVAGERHQNIPHGLGGLFGVSMLLHTGEERHLLLGQHLGLLLAHCSTQHVCLAQRITRQNTRGRLHLLLIHDQTIRFVKHFLQRLGHFRMNRRDLLQTILTLRIIRMRIHIHRTRTIQRDQCGNIVEVIRLQRFQQRTHTIRIQLEHAKRVTSRQQIVRGTIVQWNLRMVDTRLAIRLDIVQRIANNRQVGKTKEVHLD